MRTERGGGSDAKSLDGGVRKLRNFRASDAEWAFMQALAKDYKKNVSELIRECLLTDMPVTNPNGEAK